MGANPQTIIYYAAAARDAVGVNLRPAAIVVRDGVLLAVGPPGEILARFPRPPARVVDLPDALVLPAMVNAHAHLDLTALGPTPYAGDFIAWVESVIAQRPRTDAGIAAAVHHGLALSRSAGVGWLGDIAGSDSALRARATAGAQGHGVDGVSYLECFGIGKAEHASAEQALARLVDLADQFQVEQATGRLKVALQPHAPYSAGPALYQAALSCGIDTASTHLAETPEELQFIRDAAGPFADLLRRIGKWDDSIQPHAASPVQYLIERGLLIDPRWLLVHCNYISDDDLDLLAGPRSSVAYCPIASEYFHHPRQGFPPHRYRDMLAAGVNVCLGTDSILCQPPNEGQPLGILPQMRRLFRRDATDPATLLRMATTNGLRAMRLNESLATLTPNVPARLIAVNIDPRDVTDPLTQALLNDHPVKPITAT